MVLGHCNSRPDLDNINVHVFNTFYEAEGSCSYLAFHIKAKIKCQIIVNSCSALVVNTIYLTLTFIDYLSTYLAEVKQVQCDFLQIISQ